VTPRFGLGLQSDKSPAAYERLAVMAETLGFDVVSVFADLWYQPPLAALLSMARVTRRVELGPACLNPFLVHPVEIAGQAPLLDQASAGRAYVGLARGSWLGAIGVDQRGGAAKVAEAARAARRGPGVAAVPPAGRGPHRHVEPAVGGPGRRVGRRGQDRGLGQPGHGPDHARVGP